MITALLFGQSLSQWGFSIHRIVQTEIVYGTKVILHIVFLVSMCDVRLLERENYAKV